MTRPDIDTFLLGAKGAAVFAQILETQSTESIPAVISAKDAGVYDDCTGEYQGRRLGLHFVSLRRGRIGDRRQSAKQYVSHLPTAGGDRRLCSFKLVRIEIFPDMVE